MHAFANESIQPEQWMNWYAPNGMIDTSGTVLHIDLLRLTFMVSLSAPITGIFLLNYVDYTSKCDGHTAEYLAFVKNLGKKIAIVGLIISAVLFAVWYSHLICFSIHWDLPLFLFYFSWSSKRAKATLKPLFYRTHQRSLYCRWYCDKTD